ncbi:hypothetical protein VTI74DRAFT_3653 [Chaetomium olivicolor]
MNSHEAPVRRDANFDYNVGDARAIANRTPAKRGIPYRHNLPTWSDDVFGSIRSSSVHAYAPESKGSYPAIHTYSMPYSEGFGPTVMHQAPVGMLPTHWGVEARVKPSSLSSMYLRGSYSNHHGTGLHRPLYSSSDSANFSFSDSPGPDLPLPNPLARSFALPHPAALKSSATASTTPASILSNVATVAIDGGGFYRPGNLYASAASSGLSSHPSASSSSASDTFYEPIGIFSGEERSLKSQGPVSDMNSPWGGSRGAASCAVRDAGSHGYVPGEGAHEAVAAVLPWACMDDAAARSSPIAHNHGSGRSVALESGSANHAAHAEDRQVASLY